MCQPASMILRKTVVPYWSKESDSHEVLLKELGLKDNTAHPKFVRVVIVPPNGDFSRPLAEWQYHVDQDYLPPWYDATKAERQVRKALVAWATEKVFLTGTHEVRSGQYYACGDSQVKAFDSSQVKACGSSRVEAYGRSRVKAYGRSQVKAFDSSQVDACGSSRVEAYGTVTVNQWSSDSKVSVSGDAINIRRDSTKRPIPIERAKKVRRAKS